MRKEGYTLAELMIVVLIMGVMAAVAIPRLQVKAIRHKKADAVARKIVSDLRRARAMALHDAAINANGYEILMIGSPFTGYQIDNLDSLETLDTFTFESNVTVTSGADQFDFGPLGNLTKGVGSTLNVSSEEQSYTISFVTATGTVVLTED
jgi:prepilin-type N-terminal cleavage/methylation domain-containing protein